MLRCYFKASYTVTTAVGGEGSLAALLKARGEGLEVIRDQTAVAEVSKRNYLSPFKVDD